MLEETEDREELIARVAALEIGKAELVCCMRVPGAQGSGKRLQEVRTYPTMTGTVASERRASPASSNVEALPAQRAARSAQSDQSRGRRRRSGALVEEVEGGDRQMQQCRAARRSGAGCSCPGSQVCPGVQVLKTVERGGISACHKRPFPVLTRQPQHVRPLWPLDPADMLEHYSATGGFDVVRDGDLKTIQAPLDALGVNHYHHSVVAADPNDPRLGIRVLPVEGPTTSYGCGYSPESLGRVLVQVSDEYTKLPVYVTESGASLHDYVDPEGRVNDVERIDYLSRYFGAAAQAVSEGVDLRGYFVWSLFDNFEWQHGYSMRFGLFTSSSAANDASQRRALTGIASSSLQRREQRQLERATALILSSTWITRDSTSAPCRALWG